MADVLSRRKQNLSSIAQKVLDVVPIQEVWAASKIKGELERRQMSGASIQIVSGCLAGLRDAGLIREPRPGHFQRAQPKAPKPIVQVSKDARMQTIEVKKPEPTTQPATAADDLGALAGELRAWGKAVAAQANAFADKIDAAALTVEQEREEMGKQLEQVRQLKQMLRGLADDK